MNGRYTKDVGGGYGKEIEALIRDYDSIKDYADRNGLPNARRYVNELKKLQSTIRSGNEYMSQFENEEAYNKWKKDADEYEAMLSFDTKNGAKEIEHLESVLDEYIHLVRTMDGDKAQGRLKHIVSVYGGKDNLEKLITQKRAYNNKAINLQEKVKLSSVGDKNSEYYDPEFDYWSKNRASIPSLQDIENYDALTDSSTWTVGNDGKLYDVFGTEIDTTKRDQKGKVIHPAAGSVDTSDKLGIYLSARDTAADYSTNENAWGTVDQILAEGNSKHWDKLTEDQINTYYYYLNKNGAEAANR
jgi:hypothetical protein